MTPEQFCYWLQGFVKIKEDDTSPTLAEWVRITDHLQLVFKKETQILKKPLSFIPYSLNEGEPIC